MKMIKADLSEVERILNLIQDVFEKGKIINKDAFMALAIYSCHIAINGDMEKYSFLENISVIWDGVKEHRDKNGP
jgi:hypothetical protein